MVCIGWSHNSRLGIISLFHQDPDAASGIDGIMWDCSGLLRLDDRTVYLVPV